MNGTKHSLDDLRARAAIAATFIGVKIKHHKTLEYYVVESFQFREADMKLEFTYRTMHDVPVRFSRPFHELVDGRYMIMGKVP